MYPEYDPEAVSMIHAIADALPGWTVRTHPRNGETLQLIHDIAPAVAAYLARCK